MAMIEWLADGDDLVEVEVDYVDRETDDAILCRIGRGTVWIPRSQIDEASEVAAQGDAGTLVVPKWIARDRGLSWSERD